MSKWSIPMWERNTLIRRVLFLTIDCLRYDRLGYAGYPVRSSPTLDFLANSGIICRNIFAHGNPSQFSYPAIFTSTLPLDFGGYDRGIQQRPTSLPEVFRKNGFKTVAFSTVPWWNSFFGYDRGFDQFYDLYDIELFWENLCKIYFRYYIHLRQQGLIEDEEFRRILASLVEDSFDFMLKFCERKQTGFEGELYPQSPIVHRHNFAVLYKSILAELRKLQDDPAGYADSNHERLSTPSLYAFLNLSDTRARGVLDDLLPRTKRILEKCGMKDTLRRFGKISRGPAVDASYLKDVLLGWLERHIGESFFLWTSFLDIHDGNYTSNVLQPILKCPGVVWDAAQLGSSYYGNLNYDLSLKYVDTALREILDFLESRMLLDQTLIVVCGDHGAPAGAPHRRVAQPVCQFYEEFVKVPLIFWNPNLKPQAIDHLSGLIDLAPTLVDLMGFSPAPAFKGFRVYSEELLEREYVILEHAGRGPCDLKHKPIQICVRTGRYKYIWREYTHENDRESSVKHELYDLEEDPREARNVVDDVSYSEVASELNRAACMRCKAIRMRTS